MCKRICPICKSDFEEGAKFCSKCGCDLQKEYLTSPVCPQCGREYPDGTRFCDDDGSRLTTKDKLVPKCSICGKIYDMGTKYCPDDGGKIQTEYERQDGTAHTAFSNGYEKAPNDLRFVAALVDGVISALLCIPAALFFVIGEDASNDYYSSSSAASYFVIAVFLYFIPLTYSFIKDGFSGQSIGKRMVNLAVINTEDGSRCNIGRSSLRGLITMLINFIPLAGGLIEPIMVLATNDGRRLADKCANTQVIKLN